MTSNTALQRAKWLFSAAKAGHTGSLDPMATGVLPLCFGEATKFSQYLLDADKIYRCTMRLGVVTNTGDAEGEIISGQTSGHITASDMEKALERFVGNIEQVPSMFSAIKHNGQPLYKLARNGIEVERQPRPVTIYSLKMTSFRAGDDDKGLWTEAEVEAHVSKGTYIRTLAEDVGAHLGCGAHIIQLHRSKAGPFCESACLDLDALASERGEGNASILDKYLLPVEQSITHLQSVQIPAASGFYLQQGQPVMEIAALQNTSVGEMVRVVLDSGEFLGVAEIQPDGRIAPRKLLRSLASRQETGPTVNMHGR